MLEGIGTSGDWKFLYQGNEYIDFAGYNTYDFNLRQYDAYKGQFNAIDPIDNYSIGGFAAMLNNPLAYTDPNGDCPNCVLGGIGAIIGGFGNLIIKAAQGKIHSVKDGAVAFGIGAAAGFVTGFTGGMATGALGLSAASISGGAVAGAVGSATGGLVQGLGNAAYFQDSYSAKDWAIGVAAGAVLGGIGGGISARVKGGPGANLMWGPNGKPNWFTNNYGGKTPSIGFGDLEFEGAEIITNIRSVLNEGAGEITYFTTTFAGQTARNLPATYYPANNGALGSWTRSILSKGQIIDRYGSEYGSYFSPRGTPLNMRSLDFIPSGKANAYEVLKPFPIEQSKIAPAFGKIGLGIQYKSPISVSDLIRLKYIKPIK